MILEPSKKPRNQREIEDTTSWPHTTQVFDMPNVKFDNHDWVQEGYYLIDSCSTCPRQAVAIPYGKMLIKEGGKYKLIDEIGQ